MGRRETPLRERLCAAPIMFERAVIIASSAPAGHSTGEIFGGLGRPSIYPRDALAVYAMASAARTIKS